MKNIVISLKNAVERRTHIAEQFSMQQVAYQFLDALTPQDVEVFCERVGFRFEPEMLTVGERACFISHVAAWEQIVTEKLPYAAIFEDDVFLGQNAADFLNESSWIHKDWHMIKLEAFSKKVLLSDVEAKLSGSRALHQLKGRHLGGAGYILSLEAAHYLLDLIRFKPIDEPLDHILFDLKYHQDSAFKLYQMKPALCIQGYLYHTDNNIFSSGLERQRVQRRKKESQSRSLKDKLIRELRRLLVQINTALYKRPMDFK